MDLLDQLDEAKYRLGPIEPEGTTARDFTFVYQLNGQWYDGTISGSYSDCGEHITAEAKKRGGDIRKIRWARGHTEDNAVKIHPKTDSIAEARLLVVMKYRAARARKRKYARRRR